MSSTIDLEGATRRSVRDESVGTSFMSPATLNCVSSYAVRVILPDTRRNSTQRRASAATRGRGTRRPCLSDIDFLDGLEFAE